MKSKIAKVLKRITISSRPHYYHNQVMTDDLERELMRAYAGIPFIVSPRKGSRKLR
jgi:hypothetical protein